ncbi:uncharacterized protein BDV17DRAFT_260016 [Aspergillus undulatus]|uniref:uncharacterized protein n=1 Tax=Aspergillus undulatus TaxID=1810928 RepID=UPI003CCC9CAB
MSFTSFRTSIIYPKRTVHSARQGAVETTDPGRNTSVNSPDSYSHDHSKFTHTVHELLAKRDTKPDNKTSPPEKPTNDTKGEPPTNVTAAPVVKDWRYEKASIAASSIFSAVALAALILLGVMIVKKFKRRQRRKRGGDTDSLDERRRKRESLMFKHASTGSYMVEEAKDGKVVRVVCNSRNKPRNSIMGVPLQKISSALSFKKEASRHMKVLKDSDTGRSGSIAKQPVLVSSPLRSVVSRTAVHDSQATEPAMAVEPIKSSESTGIAEPARLAQPFEPPPAVETPSPVLVPRTPATSPTIDSDVNNSTEADITPCNSFRRSIFRLPSIKQSMSPIFKF